MEKTIKHLEDTGFLNRLKLSMAMADLFIEVTKHRNVPDESKRDACKTLTLSEMAKDKDLLEAIANDITNEIFKHI